MFKKLGKKIEEKLKRWFEYHRVSALKKLDEISDMQAETARNIDDHLHGNYESKWVAWEQVNWKTDIKSLRVDTRDYYCLVNGQTSLTNEEWAKVQLAYVSGEDYKFTLPEIKELLERLRAQYGMTLWFKDMPLKYVQINEVNGSYIMSDRETNPKPKSFWQTKLPNLNRPYGII